MRQNIEKSIEIVNGFPEMQKLIIKGNPFRVEPVWLAKSKKGPRRGNSPMVFEASESDSESNGDRDTN